MIKSLLLARWAGIVVRDVNIRGPENDPYFMVDDQYCDSYSGFSRTNQNSNKDCATYISETIVASASATFKTSKRVQSPPHPLHQTCCVFLHASMAQSLPLPAVNLMDQLEHNRMHRPGKPKG